MIDVSGWGEFRIGDLFVKLNLKCRKKDFKKAFDCSEVQNDEFNLPLTNAKHFNNGIQYYGREADWDSAEMTIDIVSNGAIATGDVYAQPQKTGVLWDSYLIKSNFDIESEFVLHFLACVIEKCIKQFFGWEDKCVWERVKEMYIKLPVTSSGEPDCDYMESYMKQVMDRSESDLEILQNAHAAKHQVDVTQWGEFPIVDLFDLSLPKGDLQVKKVKDGNVPLITPSKYNNGQLKRISKHSPSTLYKKGALTVDMFGNAYYQEEDFFVTAHGHVNVLLPKTTMNVYCGLFLASAIRAMFLDKYGFDEMCTQKVLKKETILLPVTHIGCPDWQYMETYMKQVMDEAGRTLSCLTRCV